MQIVAFISGKGGVGKTTLTANVAVALAKHQMRVLLIDLDPQNALRLHLGMDPEDIAGHIREGITSGSVFDSPFEVNFIPFGRANESDLQEFETSLKNNPRWLADSIDALQGDAFDFVLLDTPPGPTVYLQQALTAANRALMIVLADAASYASVPKMASLCRLYTDDRNDFSGMHILINQMPTSGKLGHQVRSALFADHAQHMVPVAIHRDPQVAQALAFERPVLEFEAGCKASLDIQYVADWLIDSVEQ
jgi:cellulose synthase operon protein YhjQ